jgi:hypothetical protein
MTEIPQGAPTHKPPRQQLDLFGPAAPSSTASPPSLPSPSPDPLIGLLVELPDACRCASNVAIIGTGTQIHRAMLSCRSCGRHRGWLSKFTADWIEQVAAKFGAPEIIKVQRSRQR